MNKDCPLAPLFGETTELNGPDFGYDAMVEPHELNFDLEVQYEVAGDNFLQGLNCFVNGHEFYAFEVMTPIDEVETSGEFEVIDLKWPISGKVSVCAAILLKNTCDLVVRIQGPRDRAECHQLLSREQLSTYLFPHNYMLMNAGEGMR